MVPLIYAPKGETCIIKKVGGSQDLKQHLQDMGFVVGSEVSLISELGGNIIVKVKESRIAISTEMAKKIMV